MNSEKLKPTYEIKLKQGRHNITGEIVAMEYHEYTCVDCGKKFLLTPANEKWFTNKGFKIPKRCKDCRKSYK